MAENEIWSIGVDVGGTFTDFSAVSSFGRTIVFKLPSTPADPSAAVLTGLDRLIELHDLPPAAIRRFAHGTTVATNAVLERKGARIGLITTVGFRDVLEIGRQLRHDLYGIRLKPETPAFLAPGAMRLGVTERIGPEGAVVTPLDEASVHEALDQFVARDVEGIAVCLLFSFANPMHERRVGELIRERLPDLPFSLSHEVDPAFREYERTVVTAFDTYIKPTVDRYLLALEAGLVERGVSASLQVMQSRGGLSGSRTARERPVRLFLSGPAGGVIGAQAAGASAGLSDLISIDIGGTSADIALIARSKPILRNEGTIDGYPVRTPMVDVNAIGSGGGSIAWIDEAGGLRVGPESAGADPGPACYGRGGVRPTVTDASLVLGFLDPDYFAGGDLGLDMELARRSIEQAIAEPLGLTVEAAALGIHRVVNAQMAEGIRLVSIRQGYDPRDFALVALGGAGPVHAGALAAELGIASVLVPLHPGVLSAQGLLAAPVEHEASASCPMPLGVFDSGRVQEVIQRLDETCIERLERDRLETGASERGCFADICYDGQSYHLAIGFDPEASDAADRLYADFRADHDRIYGYAPSSPARIVNLRVVRRVAADVVPDTAAPHVDSSAKAERPVLFTGADGPVPTAVLKRSAVADVLPGPAIVEQDDTTTVIPPGWRAERLGDGALLLRR